MENRASIFAAIFFYSMQANAAIFGLDDRLEITQDSAYSSIASSTAIAVLSSQYTIDGASVHLEYENSSDIVCKSERFSEQPYLPYACSGFLVGPNLLATAGHCSVNTGSVTNESAGYCEAYSWMFGFQKPNSGNFSDLKSTNINNFYKCKKIIFAIKEEVAPFRDYALIELDRNVENRLPLNLSPSSYALNKSKLSMIGYPFGTPAKLSQNAKILRNDPNQQTIITSLDAFEGNSGSAVFNDKNEVIGILTGGTPILSLTRSKSESCDIYNKCDEEGKNCLLPDDRADKLPNFQQTGSEVQRIEPLADLLKKINSSN